MSDDIVERAANLKYWRETLGEIGCYLDGLAHSFPEERRREALSKSAATIKDIAFSISQASVSVFTPEQPDPTAETLQEADALEAGEDVLSDEVLPKAATIVDENSRALREGDVSYAGVTIGSYSDVSDEDVRAAGGEPTRSPFTGVLPHTSVKA